MIICKICNKTYKNNVGLSRHIKIHNITYKEYYDTHIKTKTEGICPTCGGITKWNKNTYYKHCSTKCSSLDPMVVKKTIKTNYKIYGTSYALKNKQILNKQSNTNLKRYGVKHPLQNKTLNQKAKTTMLQKYGVNNIFKTDKLINNNKKTLYKKTYYKLKVKNTHTTPNFSVDEYTGNGKLYSWKCLHCTNTFKRIYVEGKIPLCPKCFPKKRSVGQNELYNFLSSTLKLSIVQNYKKLIYPYEIDFYIPSHNIAIEYNGNYWHTELNGKDKTYHINKTIMCNKNNVKLIHIFEDEWIYKKSIIKFRLKHLFNKTRYNIYARNCIIKEISTTSKNRFLNKYHIQGEDKSKIKLGAFYNNKLISVMTFSNLRIALGNKHTDKHYELSRFCTIFNFNCVGIAGKLLKHFETTYNPIKVISYADKRWSTITTFYELLGFIKRSDSPPNYWYVKTTDYLTKYHRFGFRKNVLSSKLPIFNKNITEWENMKNNNFDRIWDCGNLVFSKTY